MERRGNINRRISLRRNAAAIRVKSYRFYVILIFWAAVLITSNLSRMLWLNAGADSLSEFKPESPEFREMKLSGKKLTSLLEAEAYYGQPRRSFFLSRGFTEGFTGEEDFCLHRKENICF